MAYEFLRQQGYRIVARNYRPRRGREEIDLIGWDDDHLAFVEVKARKNEEFGRPAEAVDSKKRQVLIRAAREYARRAGVAPAWMRFDVVSIVMEDPPRIELYKGAFTPGQERQRWRPAQVSRRTARPRGSRRSPGTSQE
jgi:putative endonuclease